MRIDRRMRMLPNSDDLFRSGGEYLSLVQAVVLSIPPSQFEVFLPIMTLEQGTSSFSNVDSRVL